jgi:hypothetical protein
MRAGYKAYGWKQVEVNTALNYNVNAGGSRYTNDAEDWMYDEFIKAHPTVDFASMCEYFQDPLNHTFARIEEHPGFIYKETQPDTALAVMTEDIETNREIVKISETAMPIIPKEKGKPYKEKLAHLVNELTTHKVDSTSSSTPDQPKKKSKRKNRPNPKRRAKTEPKA